MAKVNKNLGHDVLWIRATFSGGLNVNVTFSRGGGETISVRPLDSPRAETLSNIVLQTHRKISENNAGYPIKDWRDMIEAMAAAAEKAATFDDYLDGLKTAFGVTGERPTPKTGVVAHIKTTVTCKKVGRGHQITAIFPNRENFHLTLNAKSVGLALDPDIISKNREISGFLLGLKQMQMLDDALAKGVAEAAEAASGIDSWMEEMRKTFISTPNSSK